MKEEKISNYVGIDVSKKTLELVRITTENEIYRKKIESSKLDVLVKWLKVNDIVAIEAGDQSFRIAKKIMSELDIEVIVLNPGDLATIYASLKKTDKEDALKLARLISRIPKKELPVVSIPTDEEEDMRRLSNEQAYWTKEKSRFKNRLHSLFTQAGLTDVKKLDISTKSNREGVLPLLPDRYHNEGERLHKHLTEIEETLNDIEEEVRDYLKKNLEASTILLSMPGIGLVTCLSLLSYIGNIDRFSSSKQVSYYVGLVPRVDISGSIVRYGHIVKHGCRTIKRLIVQCAWSLVKSKSGGALRDFYLKKKDLIGKGKSIVAVARKMIEVLYTMLKNGETYRYMEDEVLTKKLKRIGIM